MHEPGLPVATDASDRLRLRRLVLVLRGGQERVHEDGVVRRRQVGARRRLVAAQQKQHPRILLGVQVLLLELVQRARLLVHGALQLERLDARLLEHRRHLLHQVGELHKHQDALVARGVLDALHEVRHLRAVRAHLQRLVLRRRGDRALALGLLRGALQRRARTLLRAERLSVDHRGETRRALAAGNAALLQVGQSLQARQTPDVAARRQDAGELLGVRGRHRALLGALRARLLLRVRARAALHVVVRGEPLQVSHRLEEAQRADATDELARQHAQRANLLADVPLLVVQLAVQLLGHALARGRRLRGRVRGGGDRGRRGILLHGRAHGRAAVGVVAHLRLQRAAQLGERAAILKHLDVLGVHLLHLDADFRLRDGHEVVGLARLEPLVEGHDQRLLLRAGDAAHHALAPGAVDLQVEDRVHRGDARLRNVLGGALLRRLVQELDEHLGALGVARALAADRALPLDELVVLLLVLGVEQLDVHRLRRLLPLLVKVARVENLLVQRLFASLELILAHVDDVLARAHRVALVVVQLKLGAALDQRLLRGGGALQHLRQPLVAVALVAALLLLLRLHVHRLQVVVQLEVDGALRRAQRNLHRDLLRADLVNLGDVLAHEAVQEALRDGVPVDVPLLRRALLEELKRLRLGDLALRETRLLVRPEVGAQQRRRVLDLGERAHRGRPGEHPARLRLQAEHHAPVRRFQVRELVHHHAAPVEHLQRRRRHLRPIRANLARVQAPVVLVHDVKVLTLLVILVIHLGALLGLRRALRLDRLAAAHGLELLVRLLLGIHKEIRVVVDHVVLGVRHRLGRRALGRRAARRRSNLVILRRLLHRRRGLLHRRGLGRGLLLLDWRGLGRGLLLLHRRGLGSGLLLRLLLLLARALSLSRLVHVPEALLAARRLGGLHQLIPLEALGRDDAHVLNLALALAHALGRGGGAARAGERLRLRLEARQAPVVGSRKVAPGVGRLAVGHATGAGEPRESLEVERRAQHARGADDHVRVLDVRDGKVRDVRHRADDHLLQLARLRELFNLARPLPQQLRRRQH